MSDKVDIRRLATGVPGLDDVLGGGLPEFSFNLITGLPGSGKTTLANQIMFSLVTPQRSAIYFTVLGEPPLKMLRYQQQFSFFDIDKFNTSIRFINLSDEVATGDLTQVLHRITREVEARSPGLVFLDSLRAVTLEARGGANVVPLQHFIQRLGMQLSTWQATTFLVGEYASRQDPHPIFTVADGILSLSQDVNRNSMVRKLEVLKMRGQGTSPGLHTFRIDGRGVHVFPSTNVPGDTGALRATTDVVLPETRLSMGTPVLDAMLGGGLPSAYSLLVAGPSGSGKTVLANHFLTEGIRRGEPGVLVAFEQTPSHSRDHTIDGLVQAGKLGLINTRSLDLSIDEVVFELTRSIKAMHARRVVIDSLSGFELAVAPTFREDFRESLFRMLAALAALRVTVVMTSELEDRYTDLRFSPNGSAFLTDAIIVQRYVEIESRFERVMAVVKVRASEHCTELRRYEITDAGLQIEERMLGYDGLLGGRPLRVPQRDEDSR